MEIDALKSFLAFVETGSITRAAHQVNRTQSAVSMQMKKLESDLGKKLFQKEGRNLVLTHQGHSLISHARLLVNQYNHTLTQVKTDNCVIKLRLACPDDYANTILPAIVAKIHRIWPNVELHIRCLPSNIIRQQLDNNDLDIGIVTRSFDSEEGLLIRKDRGVWVYNGNSQLLSEDVLPVVTFQQDCRFHHAAIEGLHKLRTPFKIVAQSGSVAAMHGLVKAGLAVAVMARSSKADLIELHTEKLPALPEISIVLLTNSHTQSFLGARDLLALAQFTQ